MSIENNCGFWEATTLSPHALDDDHLQLWCYLMYDDHKNEAFFSERYYILRGVKHDIYNDDDLVDMMLWSWSIA